jgi:hypothetical protein
MSYSGSSDTEAKAVRGVQSRPLLRTIWEQGRIAVGAWCGIPSALSAEALARSGFDWLCIDMPDGSMLIVSMMKRQILQRTSDGAIRVHADLNHIADFHCNDMVVDPAGRAFVGNFGFDLDAELATRGVESVIAEHATANIACVLPDGTTRVAAPGMHFPNGSVITPDGKTLLSAPRCCRGTRRRVSFGGGRSRSDAQASGTHSVGVTSAPASWR